MSTLPPCGPKQERSSNLRGRPSGRSPTLPGHHKPRELHHVACIESSRTLLLPGERVSALAANDSSTETRNYYLQMAEHSARWMKPWS
jgi:hypothetical protein